MRGGEEGVESNDEDEKGGTRAGDRGGEIEKNYRLQYKQLLHAQKKKKKREKSLCNISFIKVAWSQTHNLPEACLYRVSCVN